MILAEGGLGDILTHMAPEASTPPARLQIYLAHGMRMTWHCGDYG